MRGVVRHVGGGDVVGDAGCARDLIGESDHAIGDAGERTRGLETGKGEKSREFGDGLRAFGVRAFVPMLDGVKVFGDVGNQAKTGFTEFAAVFLPPGRRGERLHVDVLRQRGSGNGAAALCCVGVIHAAEERVLLLQLATCVEDVLGQLGQDVTVGSVAGSPHVGLGGSSIRFPLSFAELAPRLRDLGRLTFKRSAVARDNRSEERIYRARFSGSGAVTGQPLL